MKKMKRCKALLAVLSALALLATLSTGLAVSADETVDWGNMDGEGGVTAADALLALQVATGKVVATADQAIVGNVDGEGEITAADALLILQFATGKIDAFPAQDTTPDEQGDGRTAGNPIFTDIFTADPSAHVWTEAGDERLYVYPSHDQFPAQGCDFMDKYHVYSTTNMVDWYDHGQILSSDDVEWGRPEGGFMWAPDAAYKDGTYYYFFPHPSETDWDKSWKIGVATSDKPAEDFSVVTEKPDGSPYQGYLEGIPYESTRGLIDPCVFKDDDGKYYLSVGGGGKCYIAEMTDDLLGIKVDTWTDITSQLKYPGADRIDRGDGTDYRDFHEGSWIFKRGDIYYLMFPDGHDKNDDGVEGGNEMRYAIADSVMGPWAIQPEPILGSVPDSGTTHGSIVEYKGHWYIFYHNGVLSGSGNLRSVCVDEVFFNEDGTIRPVVQTETGVESIGPAETGEYAPNQNGELIINDDTIQGYLDTYTHAYDYNLNFGYVDVDVTKLRDDQKNSDGSPKERPIIEGAGETRHTAILTAPGAYLQFDGIVGGKQKGKALLEAHYGSGDNANFQVRSSAMEGGIKGSTFSYYMRMNRTDGWYVYNGVAYCIIDLDPGAENSIWLATGSGGANFNYIRVYLPEENVDPALQPKDPTVVDYSVYTGPATTYTLAGATAGTTTDGAEPPVIQGDLTLHNMERNGAYVDIPNIDGGKGGKAMVTLEYCSFNDGSLTLSANGVKLEPGASVGFVSNDSWDSYAGTVTGLVQLNAGTDNVLRVTGGMGGVNLRNITVTLLPQD